VTAHDPYDELPYTDHAYAESHPDRLSVVARLSGWEPPALQGSRILELACGRGGNLLPMAESLPRAQLVGVDLAARQVDEATRIAGSAGLGNVRFVASSMEGFEYDGAFDFVLAHGVCSWVPPATRRAMLAKIAAALAPGGVAYVSFNVLPGWYDRLAARDWLRTFPGPTPVDSLVWLRDAISPEQADYRRRIDAVVKRLRETEPAYARHEYLADEQHPQRVSELLAEAHDAGLAYLGDAIPSESALELLPQGVAERASTLAVAARQQLIDYVRCTAFRRTLFVRAKDAETRNWCHPARLDPRTLDGLRISSQLRAYAPQDEGAATERFDAPGGMSLLQGTPSVRRALHRLASIAPHSIPFAQLAADAANADDLRTEILDLWLATGGIDLHAHQPRMRDRRYERAERPEASPVARWHASHGGAITNLWHQEVQLDDPLLRSVLSRLDGSQSLDDLARALGETGPTRGLDAEARLKLAHASVEALASAALLVA
jgi:SAM-dependent methyltransferase